MVAVRAHRREPPPLPAVGAVGGADRRGWVQKQALGGSLIDPPTCPLLSQLVVSEQEQPELYNLAPGDAVSNGHFRHGAGMDVSNVRGIYTYPTVLIFAEGTGIATA